MMDPRIYLASRSPRRRELLAQVGVRFDLLLFRLPPRDDAEVNEDWLPGETPDAYVQRVARAKAEFGADLIARRGIVARPVLAADTTLDVDGEVIGKPRGEADAEAILARLSGRSHRVLTAIAMARGERVEHRLSVSEVRFRPIGADEIRRYVQSGEPMDKAGAYAIQGRGAVFIAALEGSYSGVMGLPLFETAGLLAAAGIPCWEAAGA